MARIITPRETGKDRAKSGSSALFSAIWRAHAGHHGALGGLPLPRAWAETVFIVQLQRV
jgi:hypothetical protein